jgi:hypothetical protein
VSTAITITGGELAPGTPDGLQLEGHRLFVVENFASTIVELALSDDLTTGTLADTITSDRLHVPTTMAVKGDTIAAVNGRFDLGLPPPFGPGAPPGTAFDVALVRR